MSVLLLAGTGEAKRIAWGAADSGKKIIASLAGATRQPDPLPVSTRIGGFGGDDGFRAFLKDYKITAVMDATHPFAHRITDRTARVCASLNLPYCQVLRPEWQAQKGDVWQSISQPSQVADHVPADAVVFLATGRQTLAAYSNLEGRRVLARVIDPPTAPFPFEGGEFVIGRPPFSQQREEDVFAALNITHLVVKNAGGQGGRAKLDAARVLGVPVLMLRRPPMPNLDGHGVRVDSARGALAWMKTL